MMFDVELPLRIISCSGGEHSGGISAQTQIRGEKTKPRQWRRQGEREFQSRFQKPLPLRSNL